MNARTDTAVIEAPVIQHSAMTHAPEGTQVRAAATPADLVRYAMDTNADLDKLERLMQMQTQWEEKEARKAFVADMAAFKRLDLSINKDHHVEFKTDKGITAYNHATIGNVVGIIVPALAEHGFSHRWDIERCEGGLIRVTCIITHRLGHSEKTVLEAGLDQTGGKNNIQAMISTKTYLERHSLLAATGLATSDQPDDYDETQGAGAGIVPPAAAPAAASRTPVQKPAASAPPAASSDAPPAAAAPAAAKSETKPANTGPVSAGQIANIRKLATQKNVAEDVLCQKHGVDGKTFDAVNGDQWAAIKADLMATKAA